MTNDLAIQVQGVGKKYCRSLRRTLVYGVKDVARDVFGTTPASAKLRRDEFWALSDISFEVKRGECLGLIGANGAGKSTLLKLLNGVVLPDKGTIRVHGRVGGLLELGAGFHPMLTGRENIHLSGAILGLSKEEVDEKFDSIVDFADLWDFIDTPVKYYSSGMYVRLGFSIAISIDPDTLIVDESMAVGDTAFKTRCLDCIETFIEVGKTIIVVTHNLQEIERITRRALLLDHGLIHADGLPDEVIGSYLSLLGSRPRRARREDQGSNKKQDKAVIEIADIDLCDHQGRMKCYFQTHDELQVRIKFVAHQPIVNPVFRVQIYRDDGVFCHGMNTERDEINLGQVDGQGTIALRYAALRLLSGDYSVHVSVLLSQFDEIPLHEMVASQGIHIESKIKDGGGIFAMPTEWIPSRFDDD
jgi:lipopolysaccharide transport system ATP-binding protein